MNPPLWAHQDLAIVRTEEAVRAGHRAVVITSPTGGGKTRIIAELARRADAKGKRVGIFTNRKLLTGQTSGVLARHGIDHGILAAGYEPDLRESVQVLRLQTIAARVDSGRWDMPEFDLVIVDEAHGQKADTATRILQHYAERNAVRLGFTATPVGIGHLYTALVVAGTNSELRLCGALVPCDVFAPDEPDMKGVKKLATGEYAPQAAARRVMETIVFGNVLEHWQRLNPFANATLLWAPGVPESRWFAGEFKARGVEAAHLDAESSEVERADVLAASQDGTIKVVCSCGILREGADLPWIRHGILVQACGAVSTYLQIVGRLLRAAPGKTKATLQDHAGAYHRHGSPNADRQWKLDDTDKSIAVARQKACEAGLERQPLCCPRCNGVRAGGPKCPHCGHEHARSVRVVRMTDGTLQKVTGDAVKKKRQQSAESKVWTQCLYIAANCGHTLMQAASLFHKKTGRYVSACGLDNLPAQGSIEWQERVTEVFPWIKPKRKVAQ